jgi:threonine/homoserine/homoserine lactone efflux protein
MTMEHSSLITFAIAALFLNLSPGPSLLFVTARGISEGKTAGAISAIGLASGSAIHAVLAGLGVTAIIAKSVFIINAVALIGGAYILYLGYESLKSARDIKGGDIETVREPIRSNLFKIYLQAVSVEFLNPKTILFYISILPSLIIAGGYTPIEAIFVSLIVPATALPVDLIAGLTGGLLARMSQSNKKLTVTLNYVSGAALLLIGLMLLYNSFIAN